MAVYPVVLCGGSGTRLWPTSRPARPKQFAPLFGDRSTFQHTALRLAALDEIAETLIVAGPAHRGLIRAQLAEMGLAARLIIEPAGRDSAAAIAAAAFWVNSRDPKGILVVVPADHDAPDARAFGAAVDVAREVARDGAIVTFGIKPTSPSPAYGYIRAGAALGARGARRVEAFVEKPTVEVARTYLADGYLWNSGNFVFEAGLFLDELANLAPDVAGPVQSAVDQARATPEALFLSGDFLDATKISVDYAVLERSLRTAVVPVDFPWSDLGAWDAVLAVSERDASGNAVRGEAQLLDCANSLVRAETSQKVAVVGLSGVGVIVEADAVLVCDLAASQSIKSMSSLPGFASATPTADVPTLKRLLDAEANQLDVWRRCSALPLWCTVGLDTGPFAFREAIGMGGRPLDGPRRLRVQARQIYVYGDAGLSGWEGPWRIAVERGLHALDAHYRRPDGAYRSVVDPAAVTQDDSATLYDQSFVILALAWAARAGVGGDHRRIAEALLGGALNAMRHTEGGFREADSSQPFQSNPHMHLLEAALAWEGVGPAHPWAGLADEIVDLALDRYLTPNGAIGEFFDADWRPATGRPGRLIWPGHQFEWAWLLEQWSRSRGRVDVGAAAHRLFDAGCAGIDPLRDVVVDGLLDDFSVESGSARLWPQTERLKAGLIFARRQDGREAEYLAVAVGAARSLRRYLDVPVAGAWRDRLEVNDAFADQPAPASSFYHIACALCELRAASDYLAGSS